MLTERNNPQFNTLVVVLLIQALLSTYGAPLASAAATELHDESEGKVYIKYIAVNAPAAVPAEKLAGIIAPFKRRWLTKTDILDLIERLKTAFIDAGFPSQRMDTTYTIRNKFLQISIAQHTKEGDNAR